MEKESRKNNTDIQFEQLFEALQEGYILVDEDANICDVNPAYCKMVGYSREELLQMDLHEVRPGMTKEYQQGFVENAVEQGGVEFETKHRRKDGALISLKASAAPLQKDGKIYLAGFVRDITAEKERRQRLKESEQRWQRLMDFNPLAVLIVIDNEITYINEAAVTLAGAQSKEEILGKSPLDFVIEEYQEKFKNRVDKVDDTKPLPPTQYQFQTLDGQIKTIRSHSIMVRYNGRQALQSVLMDITDLKAREQELERSEKKWQHLVEDNPQPVYVTVDGEFVFINEAGAQIYGADSPDQLVGRTVFEFSHPDYIEKVEERKYRLENDLDVENVHEHKILREDGEVRYVEVNSIPIKYQGEQAIQTVLFDVTDRKEKEALIEASLKEKEVLLKEIHHRVKNNMAVISGLLELQAMNASDNKLKNLLKESQLRIHSMAMVHEKLYQTETFSDLNFDEYVKELILIIERTVDAPTSNIEVNFDLEPISLSINKAIPAALIVNEVVVNSFKHAFGKNDEGKISIGINNKGTEITIMVRDNGKGLPDDFEMKKKNSLGINLIQTLSKQLQGEMAIYSDGGTCFTITFEVADGAP